MEQSENVNNAQPQGLATSLTFGTIVCNNITYCTITNFKPQKIIKTGSTYYTSSGSNTKQICINAGSPYANTTLHYNSTTTTPPASTCAGIQSCTTC